MTDPVRRAKAAQVRLNRAEAKAAEAGAARDAALLDAQVSGASYADLMSATDLSEARVTQVLRRERQRRLDN